MLLYTNILIGCELRYCCVVSLLMLRVVRGTSAAIGKNVYGVWYVKAINIQAFVCRSSFVLVSIE